MDSKIEKIKYELLELHGTEHLLGSFERAAIACLKADGGDNAPVGWPFKDWEPTDAAGLLRRAAALASIENDAWVDAGGSVQSSVQGLYDEAVRRLGEMKGL